MLSPQPLFPISIPLIRLLPFQIQHELWDREAIVTESICPAMAGQVKFRGTWWRALCRQNVVLEPGTVVYVVDRRSLTLIVEPIQTQQESRC